MENQNSLKPPLYPENIPSPLKQWPNWVCWKEEIRDGEPTKPSIDVRTGKKAKSNDPNTWTTFDNALEYRQEHKNNGIRGIGIQLGPRKSTAFVGIDLDDCRNTETGEIAAWAQKIIDKLASYTEISPSGTGIRIWVIAVLPENGRKKGNIEMYDGDRYLTVTGNHLKGTPLTIECRHDEIEELHREVFGEKRVQEKQPQTETVNPTVQIEDSELLQKMFNADNGAKVKKLYEGDCSDYPSQSEADLALCSHLAFWCRKDATRIDRLFRKSGLIRGKWNEKHGADTYGKMTVRKAIESTTDVYTNGNGRQKTDSEHNNKESRTKLPDGDFKHLLKYASTDAGNAECFRSVWGDKNIFLREKKIWLKFDGVRYVEDLRIILKMLKTVRLKMREASRLILENPEANSNDSEIKDTIKKCLASESKIKLTSALSIAESMMQEGINSFDQDPMILCCINGAIDLRTGGFFIPSEQHRLMRSVNVSYQAEAKCYRWQQFLGEVFAGDQSLIDFVQKAVGYSLTGLTDEQVLFICYGTGANGKSVMLNILGELLGEYALTTPASTWKDNPYHDGIPNDIARMAGARFIKSIEVKEGTRLNEERVKALTGGDKVTARFLHNEFFEFTPVCKFWIAVNHKPIIRGTDEAIWRRIRLIPFEVSFKGREDRQLYETLILELPGILLWAIEGCLKWQREGLNPPRKINEWTSSYRSESDLLAQFLEDKTQEKATAKVQSMTLYQAYEQWCKDHGEYCITGTMFGKRLQEKGFTKKKDGLVYYQGLELI